MKKKIETHLSLKETLIKNKKKLPFLKKEDHDIFKKAILHRDIQEFIQWIYRKDLKIKCPIHLGIGQELPAVLINKYLKENDSVYCHHRSHNHFLSKTNNVYKFFCELLGNPDGINLGFAGSQDISYAKKNFHAGAIVTGGLGIAVGTAMANKLKKLKNISIAVFGEGAAHQGLFWESINYANLKSLPVIFMCENNYYATYSPYEDNFKSKSLSSIAASFGIKTLTTNTFDYSDLKTNIKKAVFYARSGLPIFIEILTYRYSPHVGPDDDTSSGYRNQKEIDFWKSFDLINFYKKKYNFKNSINTPTIASIYKKAKKSKKKYTYPNWKSINFSDTFLPLYKKIIVKKNSEKLKSQNFFIPNPY